MGKVGNGLRVTVSLVNVADEEVLWSQRYDVTEKDFYALQDSAAVAIASALGVGLDRRADARLAAHRTANPEAHDLVLRGQFLVEQNAEAGLRQAITLFERAASLDSTYADPWNGIAQAWFFLADTYLAPRAAVPPMRAAIEKALALDPASAWAHALHGSLLASYVRDYPAAEREYLKAIALDSTSPFAGDYGWLLHGRGLDDSALAVVRRARRHNPFAFAPTNLAETIFSNLEMFDSATALCQALKRIASYSCAEKLLIQQGRSAEALAAWRAKPPTSPEETLDLAEALAHAGDTAAARRQLSAALTAAGSRYVREDYVASVYLALGDTARTLDWLERGLAAQAANMPQVNRTWRFKPLHGNPGFAAIVRKAGLQAVAVTRLAAALADRYRIERELGAGGMATVYLAQDLKHDRKVAIKVLRPELAAVIGAERFLSEIRTTANLQHPHILPLFDSGAADCFLFYVMPFIEGESLRDRLHREKQLPVADAVRIATEVAGALDYAHRHGVIHRDIKPENILLHDGRALVADFGIALAASKAGGGRMTETGMSLGTPHYMSPEQAMGEREITARSDVYALGA